jgi:hypothetical protein
MIEFIQHLLGICPDHAAHIDLIDIFIFGGIGWISIFSKSYYYRIKNFINKKRHNSIENNDCICDHDKE